MTMMPGRYGRGGPLISNKHEITWSNLAQNASGIQNITISQGKASADTDIAQDVTVGHKLGAIYFEIHFAAETVTNPKVIHWTVELIRAGQTSPVPSLYFQDTRSQILHRGMEMLPKDVSTVFKRIFVVKVPRTFQRTKMNQTISFRYISSSAETINACGFAIYKDYS